MKVTRVHFKQLHLGTRNPHQLWDKEEHKNTATCKLVKATGLMAPVELSRVESSLLILTLSKWSINFSFSDLNWFAKHILPQLNKSLGEFPKKFWFFRQFFFLFFYHVHPDELPMMLRCVIKKGKKIVIRHYKHVTSLLLCFRDYHIMLTKIMIRCQAQGSDSRFVF